MGKGRLGAIAVTVALLGSTIGPPAAPAATEFGTTCVAGFLTGAEGLSYTVVNTKKTPGADDLPLAVPMAGVLTEWKAAIGFDTAAAPEVFVKEAKTLKVLRSTGIPKKLRVIGESAPELMATGQNAYKVRISVQPGDLLGINADYFPYCGQLLAEDVFSYVEGAPLYQGGVGDFSKEESANLVPLRAVIEPDADNDGYGDETQDRCPADAAVQADCALPPAPRAAVLDIFAFAKRRSIQALVASSAEGPVTVSGRGLVSSTQVLGPGKLGRFTLRFTKALKASLAKLPRGKSKKLTLTASGTGATVPQNAKVVVRGWDVGKKASK